MRVLTLLLLGGPALVIAQEATQDFDWVEFLERFGFPLSALVLLLVTGARRVWVWGWQLKAVEAESVARAVRIAALETEIGRLHDAQLHREQQLVAGLAPRVYDAALLYRETAEHLAEPAAAPPPADMAYGELVGLVKQLAEKLDRPGDPDPG